MALGYSNRAQVQDAAHLLLELVIQEAEAMGL